MIKIVDNQELKLEYKRGFGAWTYHLRIPGTADIEGKWGFLKVSGTIDDYEVKSINLAPRKNEDKIISINRKIRDAIGKSGGDTVNVTLFCTIKILDTSDTNDFKREILGGNAGTLSDNTVFRACSTNQFSPVSRAKVELDF